MDCRLRRLRFEGAVGAWRLLTAKGAQGRENSGPEQDDEDAGKDKEHKRNGDLDGGPGGLLFCRLGALQAIVLRKNGEGTRDGSPEFGPSLYGSSS